MSAWTAFILFAIGLFIFGLAVYRFMPDDN